MRPQLCFRYYAREDAQNAMWYINGTRLDNRIVRTDWDAGFIEGRQFGRGKSGGQVRTSRSFLTNHLGLCQADCCVLSTMAQQS